jgi:hypothetical protein
MNIQGITFVSMIAVGLAAAQWTPAARAEEMPLEVRNDVQRIYEVGQKFDSAHLSETCPKDKVSSPFRCFQEEFDKTVAAREPSVTGYVVLLSIGTVVLAEERQRILDQREGPTREAALQRNSLDTAELLVETLEHVSAKTQVIAPEKPVMHQLMETLKTRAEALLRPAGRSLASTDIPRTLDGAMSPLERREALRSRLSRLTAETVK